MYHQIIEMKLKYFRPKAFQYHWLRNYLFLKDIRYFSKFLVTKNMCSSYQSWHVPQRRNKMVYHGVIRTYAMKRVVDFTIHYNMFEAQRQEICGEQFDTRRTSYSSIMCEPIMILIIHIWFSAGSIKFQWGLNICTQGIIGSVTKLGWLLADYVGRSKMRC